MSFRVRILSLLFLNVNFVCHLQGLLDSMSRHIEINFDMNSRTIIQILHRKSQCDKAFR